MMRCTAAGRIGRRLRRPARWRPRSALTRALPLCALIGVPGCAEPGDERLDRLNAAWALWNATAPADYRFDYRRSCFCPDVEEVRIGVADGIVVRVTRLETLEPLPAERNPEFPTIDALFVELDQLVRADPHVLDVEYDREFGFPASAEVDIEERMVDEEFAYTVREFAAVPSEDASRGSPVQP